LVYVVPETASPISYDSCVDELSARMQADYTPDREHLNVAAERNKRYYNLRVKPHKYAVSDWVDYFNPRKLVGRQDKWRRKFGGPYLVAR